MILFGLLQEKYEKPIGGYVAGAEVQSATAVTAIKAGIGLVPAAVALIAMIVFWKCPHHCRAPPSFEVVSSTQPTGNRGGAAGGAWPGC